MRRWLLIVTVLFALTGCGGSHDEDRGLSDPGEIRAVAREYVDAIEYNDEIRMCALLTPDAEEKAGGGIAAGCQGNLDEDKGADDLLRNARHLLSPNGPTFEIAQLDWRRENVAQVRFEHANRWVRLRKVDGRWLVKGLR